MLINITLRNQKGSELTFNEGDANFQNLKNAILITLENSIGTSAPLNPVAGQYWLDISSSPSVLKIRNLDNDAWITLGLINQSTNAFLLEVAQGGTGRNTLADKALVVGAGTNAVNTIAPGANGEVLTVVDGEWKSETAAAAAVVYQPD